jgi:hypothetical protein
VHPPIQRVFAFVREELDAAGQALPRGALAGSPGPRENVTGGVQADFVNKPRDNAPKRTPQRAQRRDLPYKIEFYQDNKGDEPVRRWMKEELSAIKRRALGKALQEQLQRLGIGVCGTRYGRQLGEGLFEFRLDEPLNEILGKVGLPSVVGGDDALLLRVFCHAHGSKIVLLLGGYDKGGDVSTRRQQEEIAIARKRLTAWRVRQKRAKRP